VNRFASVLVFLLLLLRVESHAFNCSVATTPLTFGDYDVFSHGPLDSTGTIRVDCNNPPSKPLSVVISVSKGGNESFNPRQMRGGGDRINYFIHTDSTRGRILGDGTGGSVTLENIVSNSAPWTTTVYGRIPPGQDVGVGVYSDALTVNITW